MITYQIESLTACLLELKAMAPEHWSFAATKTEGRTLDVNWDLYLHADKIGRMCFGTIREHGRLIGYLAMILHADVHAKATVIAESSFYYVEDRPMRGLLQRNLIRFVRDHLLEKGIVHQKFRNKMARSNAAILENLGFVADEVMYVLKR